MKAIRLLICDVFISVDVLTEINHMHIYLLYITPMGALCFGPNANVEHFVKVCSFDYRVTKEHPDSYHFNLYLFNMFINVPNVVTYKVSQQN